MGIKKKKEKWKKKHEELKRIEFRSDWSRWAKRGIIAKKTWTTSEDIWYEKGKSAMNRMKVC